MEIQDHLVSKEKQQGINLALDISVSVHCGHPHATLVGHLQQTASALPNNITRQCINERFGATGQVLE